MSTGTNRNDEDRESEPSERFVSLVLEIEAALHEGRNPELTERAIGELSPDERVLLERTRHPLELLYGKSLRAAWHEAKTTVNPTERVPSANSAEFDIEIGLNLEEILGVRGTELGRFEILRTLGMGGHGVVFLARDPVLGRLIALKVPRPEVLVNPTLRMRFLAEGLAAALLTHPNIVTVFESGEAGGICYLAQDFISGPSLGEWLRDHALPVNPQIAAGIILQMAEAVAFAHSRQILHRDIKPGNILLAPLPSTDAPNRLDQLIPKLADFGMAKLRQDESVTCTGAVLGTPAYMSPEQAAGRRDLIDETSDVYSLGAVLYELLTHQPLYRGETALDIVHQVLHNDPPHPRSSVSSIPHDLQAICLKCLRREPRERYRSAQELVDDLRRFLEQRPVLARPPSPALSLCRWGRRNPAVATLSTLAIVATLTLLLVSLWFNSRLNETLQTVERSNSKLNESLLTVERHEKSLQARTEELRRRVYGDDLRRAANAWQDGKATEARYRLHACLPLPGESDLRSFPWWMLSRQMENSSQVVGRFETGAVSASVAVNQSGNTVASGEPDGVIRLRSLPDGQLIGELRGHARASINSLHFSPVANDERLVSAGDDGKVCVWDLMMKQSLHVLQGHQGWVATARFIGEDAEAIASGGEDRSIRIWDSRSGELLTQLSGHTAIVRSLAESAATGLLFSSGEDETVRVWDWKSSQPSTLLPDGKLQVPRGASWARSLALSPDGSELAAGFRGGRMLRWFVSVKDDRFGTISRDLLLSSGIRAMDWRDDETLAMGLADSRLMTRREDDLMHSNQVLSGHTDWILSVAVVHGRKDLVSISKDGTIRLWPTEEIDGQIRLPFPSGQILSCTGWWNSTMILGTEGEVFGYSIPDGDEVFRLKIDGKPVGAWSSLSVDGARLLTSEVSGGSSQFSAFDVKSGERVWQLPLGNQLPERGVVSPSGDLVFLCIDTEVWGVDVETGRKLFVCPHPKAVNGIQVTPQGESAITTCMDGRIRYWNAATGALVQERPAHLNSAQSLAISQDGSLLASAGEDLWVRVWRIADGQELASWGLESELNSLFFLDDDRTLMGFNNDELIFWSVPDRIELMTWGSIPIQSRVTVSPDHRTIVIQDGPRIRLLRGTP